ncbi:MAG TPA: hypothetical protein VFQ54_02940, partial [Thermomicrobiales bacterium]|nr:hypothetical protein [Thermomicrobiales bacterium]
MPDADRRDHQHVIPFTRRRFLAGLAGAASGLLIPLSAERAAAQDQVIEPMDPTATETPATTDVPTTDTSSGSTQIESTEPTPSDSQGADLSSADVADTTKALYFAAPGHNLTTPFLEAWTALGGEAVLGQPLSEGRFLGATGTIQQAFETLTLEYNPALDAPLDMQATHLDSAFVTSTAPSASRTKVNGCGGADASCQFFPDSGHTVSETFADFWTAHSGLQMLGVPLSESFKKGSVTSQVFERAVLDQDTKGNVTIRK